MQAAKKLSLWIIRVQALDDESSMKTLTLDCLKPSGEVMLAADSIEGEDPWDDKRLLEGEVRNLVRGAGTGGGAPVNDMDNDDNDFRPESETAAAALISIFFSDREYVPGSKTGGYSSSPLL